VAWNECPMRFGEVQPGARTRDHIAPEGLRRRLSGPRLTHGVGRAGSLNGAMGLICTSNGVEHSIRCRASTTQAIDLARCDRVTGARVGTLQGNLLIPLGDRETADLMAGGGCGCRAGGRAGRLPNAGRP
jgi:hypothetical protein